MDTLQRTLNAFVNIGEVYDARWSIEDQISRLWTELWHLSEEVSRSIGADWLSVEYYRSVLREQHLNSQDPGYWIDVDTQGDDRDKLMEALAELCPPGVYFGPHPDTPYSWGFYPEAWRDEE